MEDDKGGRSGTEELLREIEQFLYHEAELLDDRRYEEWLRLFAEDARYWIPVVYTREQGASEVAGDRELAYFDDDKRSLELRVKRLRTEFAYAENPPSRTTRFVTNVRVVKEGDGSVRALSNFMLYKNRLEDETSVMVGRREDLLRRSPEGGWVIAMRKVLLSQNVLQSKNISVFL